MKSNNAQSKKKSIFIPWFSSYVTILIVPILASSIVYFLSARLIRNEITRANSSTIKQLQEVMDGYLKGIEKVSYEIGLNSNLFGLLNLKEEPNKYHLYRMIEIIKDFNLYKASNPIIDFFYVYSKSNDFALSHVGKFESEMLYNLYHESPDVGYEEWIKAIRDKHLNEYMPFPVKTSLGDMKKSMAYMQSLPIANMDDTSLGTVVVMMDMNEVANILQNSRWQNLGTILIIDKNNNIIASTGSEEFRLSLSDLNDLNQKSGSISGKWDNQDVVLSYTSSNEANWKYISIIPSEVFYKKAKYIRDITVGSTLLCLVLGSIIAFIFTKRNYNPLKHIINEIIEKGKMGINKDINEYSFIKDAILSALEQKDEAYRKLQSQSSILKLNFLLKLLKGNLDNSIPLDEAISNYEIEFNSDNFAVLLFLIEDFGVFEKDDMISAEDMQLARLVVGNVVEERINQNNNAFVLEDGDIIACIVNFNTGKEATYPEEIIAAINESKNLISEKYGINYTVSLSNIHQTCYQISQAYHEAMEALEYRIILGGGKIIPYEDIKKNTEKSGINAFNLNTEQRFMNCIKAGDLKSARMIMHDIINNCFYKSVMPIQQVKCLMFSMVNTMINAIDELSIICDKNFLENLNPVERLLECKTVKDIENQMDIILNSVGENIEATSKKDSKNLWKDIIVFIENNYSDINLSVSLLAEHFNCNPSYLTSYFKGKTGEGLLECINRTRVEKAKELLKNTDLSLNDIAENVGYYNSSTLIRVFKKHEGITPGKFRELPGFQES